MKSYPHSSRLLLATALLGSGLAFICVGSLPAQTPKVDPKTHAAHVSSGAMPPDAAKGDPALTQQLAQMQAKVAQLEAALAKNAPQQTTAGAMPGMSVPPSAAGPAMAGMSPDPAMAGMGGGAMPPAPAQAMTGGGMAMGMDMMKMGGMMGMMDKMMDMMDKMMPMAAGPMPAAAPMPSGGGMGMMDMDMMKMGGGAMPAAAPGAPATAMSGGGGMGMMDMMKMEMAGMMGMGAMPAAPGAMPQSALPGFPGASHLYHIGATGFFLDHSQHIALTTEQKAGINKAREQALLAKSTADRAVKQAEQELWMLTAADQPDASAITAKIAEIAKLTGDERLAFIRAVGEASKLLTDPQRQSLTGFAPPAPAAPAAAPMAGMKGM